MRISKPTLSPFWRIQIVSWPLFALAIIPLKLAAFPVLVALTLTVVREPLGFLLSCGLRQLYRHLCADTKRGPRLITIVVLASAFAGTLDTLAGRHLSALLGHPEDTVQSLGIFCFRGTLYIAWSLLYFGIKEKRATQARELSLARARADAREAELKLLRSQVDPHFLFNALNTLLVLVPGNTRAEAAIHALSAHLRYSLAHRADELVPLADEFQATTAYLAVEQARYREDLVLDLRLEDAARDLRVPGVLLQPLAENAVKHGRESSEPPHHVRLHVSSPSPGALRIEVANQGAWREPAASAGPHGTGLANLRRRLALLYPGRHHLEIADADGWVRVVVSLDPTP